MTSRASMGGEVGPSPPVKRPSWLLRSLLVLLGSTIPLAACLEPAVIGAMADDRNEATHGGVTAAAGQTTTSAGGAATLATWSPPQPCDACPDDLLWLIFDSDGASCAAPEDTPHVDFTTWRVVIGLPPSRVTRGTHVLAEEPDVVVVSRENLVTEQTSGAGGTSTACVLRIVDLDDDDVEASISGCTRDVPSDGTYQLSRCDPARLPPEAIALQGAGVGQGGAPPDSGVVLVVGDTLASCDAPLATACEGDAFQLAIALPDAYVAVGRYELSDPQIAVTRCGADVELEGTLGVLAADDGSMIVRLESEGVPAPARDQELRVERCP